MEQMIFFKFLKDIKEKYNSRNAFRYFQNGGEIYKTYEEFYWDLEKGKILYSKIEGKTIGILGVTSYDWLCHAYSSILSGKQTVFLDPLLPVGDLNSLIKQMEIDVLVIEETLLEIIDEIKKELPEVTIISYFKIKGEKSEEGLVSAPITEGKTVFFTSGTSKQAKGVVISIKDICKSRKALSDLFYRGEEDLAYIPVPMHHIYGFTVLLCCLERGQEICIGNMRTLKKEIQYFQPNSLIIVPSIVEYLLKVNGFVPSIKHAVVAGCLCKKSLEDALKEKGIFLQNMYGLSETIGAIAANIEGDSITELSLSERTEAFLGEDGEVILKLPYKMEGYYKKKEATEEVLREGLFYTGDLGVIDEKGKLNINGRKKEIIAMKNGDKVSCPELDEILSGLNGVEEGAVIYKEEILIAVLTLKKGAAEDDVIEEIKEYNKQQPYFRKIHKIWFYGKPFSRTATGKLKRRILEQDYEVSDKSSIKNYMK